MDTTNRRIFILSPARCDGLRAKRLISGQGEFPLAQELSLGTATLGAVFSFLSALYFRGKLTYAKAFANPPNGVPGVLVITPGAGLCADQQLVGIETLKSFAAVEIDEKSRSYREPLERDAKSIAQRLSAECEVVFLGSIATDKYLQILTDAFGPSLRFPIDFIGRGDMSRGGLLLRSVESGTELDYAAASGMKYRGPRPQKLPKRPRMRPRFTDSDRA